MWTHHDNILESEYVRRCVEALEQDPEVVLCFANTRNIDEEGNIIRAIELPNDAASSSRSERFRCLIRPNQKAEAIFGLMRKEALSQTRLHGGFTGSDFVLLAEMGLMGRFVLIPEFLFSIRTHALQTSLRYGDPRERTVIMDPRNKGKMILPHLRRAKEFFLAINRARLSSRERLACYKHVVEWLWNYRRNVLRDVVLEVEPVMQSRLPERLFKIITSAKRCLFRRPWTDDDNPVTAEPSR
jgi:hypothetical protein